MRKAITSFLFLVSMMATAQTKINPTTQINWPLIAEPGTPTSLSVGCTTANYGQPFQNTAVTPNTYYTCGTDGWAIRSGSASGMTAGQIPIASSGTTIGSSIPATSVINGITCPIGSSSCTLPTACAGYGCPNHNQNQAFTQASIQLTGTITPTTLTIPVASTANWPAAGCAISYNGEKLCWDSTTANTLVLSSTAERGVNATPAATISSGNYLGGLSFTQAPCPTCIDAIQITATSQTGYFGSLQAGLANPIFFPANAYANGYFSGPGNWYDGGSIDIGAEIGLNWNHSVNHINNTGGFGAKLQHTLSTTAASDMYTLNIYNPSSALVGAALSWNGSGIVDLSPSSTEGGSQICTTANGACPGGATPSGAFLLSPSGSQSVTMPSGSTMTTTETSTFNGSTTQNMNYFYANGVGWNNGGSFNGNSDWATVHLNSFQYTCAQVGICQWTGGPFTHTSPGDTSMFYTYLNGYGQSTNGNDEGQTHTVAHSNQIGAFNGTITVGGANASLLSVSSLTCINGGGNGCQQLSYNSAQFPVTGWMFDSSQPSSTLTIGSYDGVVDGALQYTLSSGTVTPSTAIGTVSSCTSTLQGKPGIYGTQNCTVTMVSGTFATGNVFHLGAFPEEDAMTCTICTGSSQTMTLQSQWPFNAGDLITQGGLGGEVLLKTGWTFPIAFPVAGAVDSTHLLFGNVVKGSGTSTSGIITPNTDSGNPILSRASNTVTATSVYPHTIGNVNDWPVGSSIIVSGYTPSDLNGTFTVVTNTRDNVGSPTITWSQTGADETSTVEGALAVVSPQITLYPAAMICGTQNGTQGSANLCTNHTTWTVGDNAVGAAATNFINNGLNIYMGQNTPASGSYPSGAVFVDDQGPSPWSYAFSAQNTPSNGVTPQMFLVNGSYGDIFNILNRPANNGTLFYVGGGEPITSNYKPYYIFQDNHSYGKMLFDPNTSILSWLGGYFNAGSGYQFNGAAPLNHCLVGNGNAYVDSSACGGIVAVSAVSPLASTGGSSPAISIASTGVPPKNLSVPFNGFVTVPPVGASLYPNIQNLGSGGWTYCGYSCSGGYSGGTGSATFGVSIPSLTNNAIEITTNGASGGAGSNGQVYSVLNLTLMPGGSATGFTDAARECAVYIPSSSAVPQGIEACNIVDYTGTKELYPSWQCATNANSSTPSVPTWNYWAPNVTLPWVSTNISCAAFLANTNVWQTIQVHYTFNFTANTMGYPDLMVNGVPIEQHSTLSATGISFTSSPAVKVQEQLDGNTTAGPTSAYFDYDSASFWTATSGGLSTPPLTYVTLHAAVSSGGAGFSGAFGTYATNAPTIGSINPATTTDGYMLFAATPASPQYAQVSQSIAPYWTSTSPTGLYINFYSTSTTGNSVMDVQTACVTAGQAVGSPVWSTAIVTTTAVPGTASTAATTAFISGIAAPGVNGCPAVGMTTPTKLLIRIYADSTSAVPTYVTGAVLVYGRSQ